MCSGRSVDALHFKDLLNLLTSAMLQLLYSLRSDMHSSHREDYSGSRGRNIDKRATARLPPVLAVIVLISVILLG